MNSLLADSVQSLISRDLSKLRIEIWAYRNDQDLWTISGEIKNSAGNLCLHLCGNLQHYIGTILGKSDYKRNRELEFSSRGISKSQLLSEIDKTFLMVNQTLKDIDEQQLSLPYPEDVFGKPMTTGCFLIHLTGHLNYHLGQVNYHRRLLAR